MIQSMFVFALSAILASSSISTTANFRTSRPVIRTKRHNGFIYLKEPFQICTMEAVKAFNGEVCMIFIYECRHDKLECGVRPLLSSSRLHGAGHIYLT